MAVFPYVFPLQIGNALNVLFHSVSAGLFHLLCDMPIHVQRKGSGVVAQIGDLSFSLIKREFGVKDYGKIFLAHGGVLDRFDSVLFVAPTLAALMQILGIR